MEWQCVCVILAAVFFILFNKSESASIGNATSKANPADVNALIRLYHATGGPNSWRHKTNWLKGDPCSNAWYGVSCDSKSRITELNLHFNGLKGSIPAEVFSIQSLVRIDFSVNELNGSIPDPVNITDLMSLDLSQNFLSGPLPSVWKCPNIQNITVVENILNGSLPKMSTLKKMVELDVSHNHFSGLLPSEYGSMTSLKLLMLYDNLYEFPNEFPKSWLNLKNLELFGVDMLKGEIPQDIGTSWPNIQGIQFSIGALDGTIPESICKWRGLTNLAIIDNPIKGTIPDCIGELKNLEYLFVTQTGVTGPIPDSIGSLKNLRQLDLSLNQLYGPIPSSFAALSGTLTFFHVQSNGLNSIGDGLENLLTHLGFVNCDLGDNPLQCPLPDYMKNGACIVPECSKCNIAEHRSSCSNCIKDTSCGWCSNGSNCLEGNSDRSTSYYCQMNNWHYNKCP